MKIVLMLFVFVLAHWLMNNEPKPNSSKLANKMYLDSLEVSYVSLAKSNRKYIDIALKCNAEHK